MRDLSVKDITHSLCVFLLRRMIIRLSTKNNPQSPTKKYGLEVGVILLAENLKNVAKCEHRVCRVKRKWAKPKSLYKQKRARIKGYKTFYSCSVFSFCRYIHFREICSRKMNSICSRFARTRYIVASRQFDMR